MLNTEHIQNQCFNNLSKINKMTNQEKIHNLMQAMSLVVPKESTNSLVYCGENRVTIWTDNELTIMKTELLKLLTQ